VQATLAAQATQVPLPSQTWSLPQPTPAETSPQWPTEPGRLQARQPVHSLAGVSQQKPSTQAPPAQSPLPVQVVPIAAFGAQACAVQRQPSLPQLPTPAQSASALHCTQPMPSGAQRGVAPLQVTPQAPQLPSLLRFTQVPLQQEATPSLMLPLQSAATLQACAGSSQPPMSGTVPSKAMSKAARRQIIPAPFARFPPPSS
jgi:hypothetical protein